MATKYLLDANLSPKTDRHLADTFGFDVVSLLVLGLGELPDHDVMRVARSAGRVIVTLDEDFIRPSSLSRPLLQGIIYLDLPKLHRYVPEINRILADFFRSHAPAIDLDHALVVITERSVRVLHGGGEPGVGTGGGAP